MENDKFPGKWENNVFVCIFVFVKIKSLIFLHFYHWYFTENYNNLLKFYNIIPRNRVTTVILTLINHNVTDVTSDVSLIEKIEREFELNLGKTDFRVQK